MDGDYPPEIIEVDVSIATKRVIIHVLKRIVNERMPIHLWTTGICKQVFDETNKMQEKYRFKDYNEASAFIWQKSLQWRHYSGEPGYPVPHEKGARKGYKSTRFKWVGLYGKRNRQLCEHIQFKLEKEVALQEMEEGEHELDIINGMVTIARMYNLWPEVIISYGYAYEKEKNSTVGVSNLYVARNAAYEALNTWDLI